MLDGIELNCPEPIGSQEKPSAPFSAVYFWSNCFINIVHATKQKLLAQLNPAVGCSSLVHFILCVVGNKSHWCFCRTPGSALQIYSSIVLVSWFNPKVERQIRRLTLSVSFQSSPLIVLSKASRRDLRKGGRTSAGVFRWNPFIISILAQSEKVKKKKKKALSVYPRIHIYCCLWGNVARETAVRRGGQESALDLKVRD